MTDDPKFTQAELDEKIEARLARQKKTHEDDLAQREAEIKKAHAELTALKAEATARREADEKAIAAEIEATKLLVDPAVLELLPTELPVEKQLAWLKKAAGELPALDKVKTPVTPRPKGENKGKFVPKPIDHSPL